MRLCKMLMFSVNLAALYEHETLNTALCAAPWKHIPTTCSRLLLGISLCLTYSFMFDISNPAWYCPIFFPELFCSIPEQKLSNLFPLASSLSYHINFSSDFSVRCFNILSSFFLGSLTKITTLLKKGIHKPYKFT